MMNEMLDEIRALEMQGFEPVVAVFRNRNGLFKCLTVLESGALLVRFLEWLASGDPDSDADGSLGTMGGMLDREDRALQAIVEEMLALGYDPIVVICLNEEGRAQVLAHKDTGDLPAFIRELAADVDPSEMRDMGH